MSYPFLNYVEDILDGMGKANLLMMGDTTPVI